MKQQQPEKETDKATKKLTKHIAISMPLDIYGRTKQYQYFLNEKGEQLTTKQTSLRLIEKGLDRFEFNRQLAIRKQIRAEEKAKLTEKKAS